MGTVPTDPADEPGLRGENVRSAFGEPLAIVLCLLVASFGIATAAVVGLHGYTNRLQWLLYVLALVLAIAMTFAGSRCWERLRLAIGDEAASTVAGTLSALLAFAILAARLTGELVGDGSSAPVAAFLLAWVIAAGLAVGMAGRRRSAALAGHRRSAWIAAAALTAASMLSFVHLDELTPAVTLLTLVAVPALLLLTQRVPRLPRGVGTAIDVVLVVVFGLAAIDVAAYLGGDLASALNYQVHQSFLLGPANDVLGGRAVLVDTFSQYGAGSIYALALAFLVVPIGYGTLSLLNGFLLAAAWGIAYAVIRLAGGTRAVAAIFVATGVLVTTITVFAPPSFWPQIGPLRFGMPLIPLLCETLAARHPDRRGPLRAISITAVALSAIWSVEVFIYTLTTFAAILAIQIPSKGLPLRDGARPAVRALLTALIASVGAHLLFAAGTLIKTGEPPDWITYLKFFEVYLNSYTEPVYLFKSWPAGALVGGLYAASMATLLLVGWRRADLIAARPALFAALAGTTGYGITTFTYAVSRGVSLPYVLLPAFVLGALWLVLALDLAGGRDRLFAVGFAAWSIALVIGTSWSTLHPGWDRSALAHAFPGGTGLVASTKLLWDSPPLDPTSAEAQELLGEEMPGDGPALVLTGPDLSTEILMRSRRINTLPLGQPAQSDLIRDRIAPLVEDAVNDLQPGDRMLVSRGLLDAELPPDPLDGAPTQFNLAPVPLQLYALGLIEDRFDLHRLGVDSDSFEVVELERPKGSSPSP